MKDEKQKTANLPLGASLPSIPSAADPELAQALTLVQQAVPLVAPERRATPATCVICGQPSSAHHDFVAKITLPPGCHCDPEIWRDVVEIWHDEVSPICDEFAENAAGYCERCQHDRACHKGIEPD
ncbi:MAG: hypothetical protein ABIG63_09070 [Chloroflexota bacterium]